MKKHKHKMKFIQSSIEFLGIEGWPYRRTWDFVCRTCLETRRFDRAVCINLLTSGRKK